jgi:hypothetical protein
MNDTPLATAPTAYSERYVESLLVRLQNDVDSRKRRRSEWAPMLRTGILVLVAIVAAHEVGARTATWSQGGNRLTAMTAELEAQRGQIAIQTARIERLERAYEMSAKFGIGADLAMAIEEIALAEGIDPDIAFNLVRVESEFNPRAVSPAGALGLTQLMPETANMLLPDITREQIFDRDTNLRLGFRFYHSLLTYYEGDAELALHAYNRGPTTVDRLLAAGIDPSNGYALAVLAGTD